MDVLFQQPFTESAYTEVKSKEARAAQRKSTKQPSSKRNDTFTFVPDEHTVRQEPVLNANTNFSAKKPASQTTDVDLASNILLGTAKSRADH